MQDLHIRVFGQRFRVVSHFYGILVVVVMLSFISSGCAMVLLSKIFTDAGWHDLRPRGHGAEPGRSPGGYAGRAIPAWESRGVHSDGYAQGRRHRKIPLSLSRRKVKRL